MIEYVTRASLHSTGPLNKYSMPFPFPFPFPDSTIPLICIMPSQDARCGICGFSNFEYRNGFIRSDCGIRGYRCNGCNAIKPESWRDLDASKGEVVTASDQNSDPIGAAFDHEGKKVFVWVAH